MIELNKIINADCMKVMKDIPDKSINLICIDPPYFIKFINDKWEDKNKDVLLFWENIKQEFYRMLTDNGNLIIFQGWSTVINVIKSFDYFIFKNWIIWDRKKGRGAKRNFVSTREDILWFAKNENYTFNKIESNIKKVTKGFGEKNGKKNRILSNIWTDIGPLVPWSREYTGWPTQKPVALIERIIKVFSNENDTVLDCFAGSGTTGEACKNLNRNCILIEKEKEAIYIINKRMGNL
jgi:DNA modification methylase